MTQKLTEIIDEFQFENENYKIIKINQKKIMDGTLINSLGDKLLTYLSKEEDDKYDKELSDSNSNYCLDFSEVEYLSSAFYGKLIILRRK